MKEERDAKTIVDDMLVESNGGRDVGKLRSLASELLRVTSNPAPQFFLSLRLRNESSDPGNIQGALVEIRAAWVLGHPPQECPLPIRDDSGKVVGSWSWMWLGE